MAKHTSKTHREIAADLSVSHSAVTKILKIFISTGTTLPIKGRGRHCKTSHRTDLLIRREVVKHPFITARSIKDNLSPICDNISITTIKRRLVERFGFKGYKPVKKPLFSLKKCHWRVCNFASNIEAMVSQNGGEYFFLTKELPFNMIAHLL